MRKRGRRGPWTRIISHILSYRTNYSVVAALTERVMSGVRGIAVVEMLSFEMSGTRQDSGGVGKAMEVFVIGFQSMPQFSRLGGRGCSEGLGGNHVRCSWRWNV